MVEKVTCKAEVILTITKEGDDGPITADEIALAAVLTEQHLNSNQKIMSDDLDIMIYPRIHILDSGPTTLTGGGGDISKAELDLDKNLDIGGAP